jgi:hypothetical protein
MTEPLIRGELGYYRNADDKYPVYGNYPRHFHFAVPTWTLRTSVESDELSTEGVEKPWELVRARKVEPLGETPLALGFSSEPTATVSAYLLPPSDRSIGVINENAVRPFAGTMPLHISEGAVGSGRVRLFPPLEGSPHFDKEMLAWDIKLPRTQMQWLREELTRRPAAVVGLAIEVAAFQNEAECMGTDYWMHQTFSFEQDTSTPIVNVKVSVMTPEQPANAPAATEGDFDDLDDLDEPIPPPLEPRVDQFAPLQMRLNLLIALLALILLTVVMG